MNTKQSKRMQGIFLLLFFLLALIIIFIAIVFPAIMAAGNPSFRASAVDVPTVSAMVSSGQDGTMHNVQMNVTLQLEPGARENVNTGHLQHRITEIMQDLDFDMIQGENSSQYVRTHIEAGLADYIDPDDFIAVHITDMIAGDVRLPLDDPTAGRGTGALDGLFRQNQ